MSAAIDLVQAATADGAKFTVSQDRVIVSAPQPLARELVEDLRRVKAEILRLLTAELSLGDGYQLATEARWWRHHLMIRIVHWELDGKRARSGAQRLAFLRSPGRVARTARAKVTDLAMCWL